MRKPAEDPAQDRAQDRAKERAEERAEDPAQGGADDMTFAILAVVLLGASALAVLASQGLLSLPRPTALRAATVTAVVYGAVLFARPDLPGVPNLSVLLGGVALGFLLSQLLGSSGSVLAFLCTAAMVDLLSFSDGLTNQIFEAYRTSESTLLLYLAMFWEVGGRDYAVVGVGDLGLLTAAYLGFRRATGAGWSPALCLLAGLSLAYLVGYVRGGAPGIPFLAAGGMVFLLLYRRNQSGSRTREGGQPPGALPSPWPEEVHSIFTREGVRLIGFVPDAGLKRLIELCLTDTSMSVVSLTTEEEGIGLALGGWLGGKKAALLLQSSGVGNTVNALAMAEECRLPLLLVVTMRGEEGEFNPWQRPMGRATTEVLEAMGVEVFRAREAGEVAGMVRSGLARAYQEGARVAVLVSQSVLGPKTFQNQGER